jgi:hypothetical protein
MAIKLYDNLEGDTTGALPAAFTNLGSANFLVSTTTPLNGSKSLAMATDQVQVD